MDITVTDVIGVTTREQVANVTGMLSVFLLLPTKWPRLQWTNWVFSIISASIYLFLFHEWALYGNAILQVPFIIISFLGAWKWRGQLFGIVDNVDEIPITWTTPRTFFTVTAVGLASMLIVFPFLTWLDDANALMDGLLLTLSLSAIYLQLKKHVESWFLWIIVDVIAVPFHISQDRNGTAWLYGVYLVFCVFGLYTWQKEASERKRVIPHG